MTGTMHSLRRAALLLHAMSGADQAWLLAQLSSPDRNALRPLLAELSELGIPADADLLNQISASAMMPTDAVRIPPASLDEAIAQLRVCPAVSVCHALRNEAVLPVAFLLALNDWPWRRDVLESQGVVQRRRIEEHLSNISIDAPKFAFALVTGVLKAAHAATPVKSTDHTDPRDSRSAGWWQCLAGGWERAFGSGSRTLKAVKRRHSLIEVYK